MVPLKPFDTRESERLAPQPPLDLTDAFEGRVLLERGRRVAPPVRALAFVRLVPAVAAVPFRVLLREVARDATVLEAGRAWARRRRRR